MRGTPRGFAAAKREAERYAHDKTKTRQLLSEVLEKAYRHRGQIQKFWHDLMSVCRMIKVWARGEYRAVSWKTIILSLAAVIYFLNPMDIAPDFIPGVGYLDDAVVLGYVISSIRADLERFLRWEEENPESRSEPEFTGF
ncbi:MAG: YkvA family protein [Acidobacteriota bacterium]